MATIITIVCHFVLVFSTNIDSTCKRRLPVVAFEAEHSKPLESLALSEDGRHVFLAVKDAVHHISADRLSVTAKVDTELRSKVVVTSNSTGRELMVVCGHKLVRRRLRMHCRAYHAPDAADTVNATFTFIKDAKPDPCDVALEDSALSLQLTAFTLSVDPYDYEDFIVGKLVVLSSKATADCINYDPDNKSATLPHSKLLLTDKKRKLLLLWGRYFDVRFGYVLPANSRFRQHFVAGFDFGTFFYVLKSYGFPAGHLKVSYITRHCGADRRLSLELPVVCRGASRGDDYSVITAATLLRSAGEQYVVASFGRRKFETKLSSSSAICVYRVSDLEVEFRNTVSNCTVDMEYTPYHTRIIPWEARGYVQAKRACQKVSLKFYLSFNGA